MTREEALKILKYRSGWNLSIRDANALDMAIKALEQEPCEDAISRQAAIDEIKSHYRVDNDLLEVIAYKISKLPSVQPKQTECEDVISRADAINKVTNFYTNCERLKMFQHTSNEVKQTVVDILSDLPLVQPKLIEYEDAINREQAVKTAIEAADDWDGGYNLTRAEIIEKAIKALPSVQPKMIECEDAISREEAIGAVANLFEMNEYPHPYSQGKPIRLRDIKEKLKQLPPVQPKTKTGHWIDDEFGSKCSCCGIHTHLDKFDKPMKFKHCSMCGAKIVEPQESEEV